MMAFDSGAVRLQPGVEAERNAEHDRHHQRGKRQLERRRHALTITFSAGSPKMKELPRSPLQGAVTEMQVLLPDRPIEAQRADRPPRSRLVGICGLTSS